MSELGYVLITPYSLLKSRTGGIIGRILSLVDLDFIGARMYAPSDAFIDGYKSTLEGTAASPAIRNAMTRYLDEVCRPRNRLGHPNRMLLLLFRGENAAEELDSVIGPVTTEPQGDTIRGTFGDFIAKAGSPDAFYFEPAVLSAPDAGTCREQLRLFAEHAEGDGGVLEDLIPYPKGARPETTVVILKPETLAERSAVPGNIIDMFSKTGLYIVGAKVVRMSVAQAIEFYGFLRRVFREKLRREVARRLKGAVEEARAFEFPVTDEQYMAMAEILKEANAEREFGSIVEYMTGRAPSEAVSEEERRRPGRAKCLTFLYQGADAVRKIRAKLGQTDPAESPGGTVRHDYGADLLKNGAHGSDSVEAARRERAIIGLTGGEPSEEKAAILDYLAASG